MSKKYKPVLIESVKSDGTVGIVNAFVTENASVRGNDPNWPREKLVKLATLWMARWNESYFGKHYEGSLRISK